jgi:tetratricopeptide (TPR) repeat protein
MSLPRLLVFSSLILSITSHVIAGSSSALIEQITILGEKGMYLQAAELAESASSEAAQKGQLDTAASFDGAVFHYRARLRQHDKALEAALRGRNRALQAKSWQTASMAAYGIVYICLEADNNLLALDFARQMMDYAERATDRRMVAQRLMYGTALRRLSRLEEAQTQFELALEEADAEPAARRSEAASRVTASRLASIRDQIGHVALARKDTAEAERHFTEAHRQRSLFAKAEIRRSYYSLSKLRSQQGRWLECIHFATLGLLDPSADPLPSEFLKLRAEAYLRLGRVRDAFDDLLQASQVVGNMRLSLPFGDALQMSREGEFQEIYSLLVEAGAVLHRATRRPSYLTAALEAAMENRAFSLRARIGADPAWRERLPANYWTKLAELRAAEIRMLRNPTHAPDSASVRLRAEVAAMESLAGMNSMGRPDRKLVELRAALQERDVLIAFHLGTENSYRFVVTKNGIAIHPLPPRGEISNLVDRFRELLKSGNPQHVDAGLHLYQLLFAGTPDTPRAFWIVMPDETLFRLPFSALVCSKQGSAEYLVQRHSLELIPAAVVGKPRRSARSSMLLVGDPVANRADPRIPQRSSPSNAAGFDLLEFPRLAGSAAEIDRCARSWTSGPKLSLTGPQITLEGLRRELSSNPMALHLATHIYQPPQRDTGSIVPPSPVITLGLSPTTGWSLLAEAQITALTAPTFVAMSGCGSGGGALAPGTGLLGLTRAWLMAGSQAVVATLWPVLDDRGEFFEEYYRALQARTDQRPSRRSAQALAAAQVKALKRSSAGHRVEQWSSYFSLGVL